MIEVQHLSKGFNGKPVLQDVSVTMHAGMCNLIIGTSGSGKTVLMKCMVGLFEPDAGTIYYNGEVFSNIDKKEKIRFRRQIGMLFQGSALFDSMTVEQNIMFPLDMFSSMSYKEKIHRVNEVLDRVNLVDAHKKFPSEISGGMKKRVGIARAIVLNPQYLFCDEPNSGLDPQTSMVIDRLIMQITKDYNMTTIINTHDMNSVMEMGEHILYMYKGQKQWDGSKDDIIYAEDQKLNDFIFPSDFFRDAKQYRMQQHPRGK